MRRCGQQAPPMMDAPLATCTARPDALTGNQLGGTIDINTESDQKKRGRLAPAGVVA